MINDIDNSTIIYLILLMLLLSNIFDLNGIIKYVLIIVFLFYINPKIFYYIKDFAVSNISNLFSSVSKKIVYYTKPKQHEQQLEEIINPHLINETNNVPIDMTPNFYDFNRNFYNNASGNKNFDNMTSSNRNLDGNEIL